MSQRPVASDDLPAELEYLRAPALAFVDDERQIVGCGQVDFGILERAIHAQTRGLSTKEAKALRQQHRKLLSRWLADHEASEERLVVGMRFVAMLLVDEF